MYLYSAIYTVPVIRALPILKIIELCSTYPHISAWSTHHGRCWSWHDGGWRDSMRKRCKGVLVCMLMSVLVLMLVLVLVELCP